MKDLTTLQPHEALWLWRLRWNTILHPSPGRRADMMTIQESSAALALTEYKYTKLERGGSVKLSMTETFRIVNRINSIILPVLTVPEMLLLARHRSGVELQEMAAAIERSQVRTLELERRGDPRLVRFWQDRGFLFEKPNAKVANAGDFLRPAL